MSLFSCKRHTTVRTGYGISRTVPVLPISGTLYQPSATVSYGGYYTLPSDLTYPWADYCGVPGGIPSRTTVYISLGTPGQLPSYEQTEVTAATIIAAISSCPAGQVVYLHPGTYRIGQITFTGMVEKTLRGAGPGQTIIRTTSNYAITFYADPFMSASGVALSGSYPRLAESITLTAAAPATITVGGLVCLSINDDPDYYGTGIGVYRRNELMMDNPTVPPSNDFPGVWGLENYKNMRFVTRVTSISADRLTIGLATPVSFAMPASLSPAAYSRSFTPPSLCGVEDLTVTFDGAVREGAVQFARADRCWAKNIEYYGFQSSYGAAYFIETSQCEIRRFYAHDCVGYPSQSDGYPFVFTYGATCCKAEDGIMNQTSSSHFNGASACVVLYCYGRRPARGSEVRMRASFGNNHGPYSHALLFEGNIGSGYHSDGYHGGSGPTVLYRNHFNGLGYPAVPELRKIIDLARGSYYHCVVGNILGDASWVPTSYQWVPGASASQILYVLGIAGMDSMAYPNYTVFDFMSGPGSSPVSYSKTITVSGSPVVDTWAHYHDPDVESTLIRHGNYDYLINATRWNPGDSTSLSDSLFYTEKPSYFGSLQWPPIGPDVIGLATNNPAKNRWDTYAVSGVLSDLFADED